MRNREFVFTPKIEYELVAERSEANPSNLQFPTWCEFTTKLELFSKIQFSFRPASAFGRAEFSKSKNFPSIVSKKIARPFKKRKWKIFRFCLPVSAGNFDGKRKQIFFIYFYFLATPTSISVQNRQHKLFPFT